MQLIQVPNLLSFLYKEYYRIIKTMEVRLIGVERIRKLFIGDNGDKF